MFVKPKNIDEYLAVLSYFNGTSPAGQRGRDLAGHVLDRQLPLLRPASSVDRECPVADRSLGIRGRQRLAARGKPGRPARSH